MKTACLLLLLSLAGCASAPGEPREPRRVERCDAFGCCEDDFGRRRCCDTRRDPFCDRYNDPYWRHDRSRQDDRHNSPLPPLPPMPLPAKKGLPRL